MPLPQSLAWRWLNVLTYVKQRRRCSFPRSEAFDGLRQAIEKVSSNTEQAPEETAQVPTVGAMSGLLETLVLIEYRIAEVFAQMAGDAPL